MGHSGQIRPKEQEDGRHSHRYRNLPEPGVRDQYLVWSQGGPFEVDVQDIRPSMDGPHQLEVHTLHNGPISQDANGTVENGGVRTK